MKYHISTQEKKNDAIRQMLNLPVDGSHSVEIKKIASLRTGKQNNALWLWFDQIADEFLKKGQSINVGGIEIFPRWKGELVCDLMFRPILKAITGKDTTRTTINKLSECIDYMDDGLHNIGYYLPVPSKEQLKT